MILALSGLLVTAAAQGPVSYALLPAQSHLSVLVKYDRSALISGHDHVVEPSSFAGSVTWDAANPSACAIDISFPVTALVVDPNGARSRFALEGSTSDGDKKNIKSNIEGKHQLQASTFPSVAFKSTSCVSQGGAFVVTGPLSLHGVAHTVKATMTIEATDTTFHATGRFQASHADWGFDPFTALLGSLKNDKALSFNVDVRGHAK